METLKIGQRVYLPPCGSAYQPGDLTGDVVGVGTSVEEGGSLSLKYLILLDNEFRGYVGRESYSTEKANCYISTIVAHVDGVYPLEG